MVGWHQSNEHEFEQLRETVKDREAWCAAVPGITKTEQQAEISVPSSSFLQQRTFTTGRLSQICENERHFRYFGGQHLPVL